MAEHAAPEYLVAEGNDYAEHEDTYRKFILLSKWGVGVLVVLLILMAYFLV
ncbi:MAG: aa3-type cytochrome c oxidase subunit IV [Pseudorhodoplanes sp.]